MCGGEGQDILWERQVKKQTIQWSFWFWSFSKNQKGSQTFLSILSRIITRGLCKLRIFHRNESWASADIYVLQDYWVDFSFRYIINMLKFVSFISLMYTSAVTSWQSQETQQGLKKRFLRGPYYDKFESWLSYCNNMVQKTFGNGLMEFKSVYAETPNIIWFNWKHFAKDFLSSNTTTAT